MTDVRQTKGLEFDEVVLLETTASSYPVTPPARHALYVGATRAAHQLWCVASDAPSPLVRRRSRAPKRLTHRADRYLVRLDRRSGRRRTSQGSPRSSASQFPWITSAAGSGPQRGSVALVSAAVTFVAWAAPPVASPS